MIHDENRVSGLARTKSFMVLQIASSRMGALQDFEAVAQRLRLHLLVTRHHLGVLYTASRGSPCCRSWPGHGHRWIHGVEEIQRAEQAGVDLRRLHFHDHRTTL